MPRRKPSPQSELKEFEKMLQENEAAMARIRKMMAELKDKIQKDADSEQKRREKP